MRWFRKNMDKTPDAPAPQEHGKTEPKPQRRTARDARAEIRSRPLPEIEETLAAHKLPSCLVEYVRGTNTMIDRGFLSFGRIYKVKKTIHANRLGALNNNDEVRFLGASVFPYDNGLRLYFENVEKPGEECVLEFEGNFPEADGVLRMLDEGQEGAYLSPETHTLWFDQRTLDLLDVERILRKTAFETVQLSDQAYQNALPHYQKTLFALQEEHAVYGPACAAVLGADVASSSKTTSLDHRVLRFGKTYLVTQNVQANRSGTLDAGTRAYFLGVETRFGEEVTLAFELENGEQTALVFYPTTAQDAAGCQPMLNSELFFQEITDGLTPRGQCLLGLRDVFLDLIKQRQETGT